MAPETIDKQHIVSAYDEDLDKLNSMILRMGGLAEAQLATAIDAVARRDAELAQKAIDSDEQIDELEAEADEFATRMIALRQPMAVDLRHIVGGLKVSADLERVGDYARNIAKRSIVLSHEPALPASHGIPRIGGLVRAMVKDVLDAYARRDVDLAVNVWHRDAEVDRLYTSLFRELLTYMMEDPRTITRGTHLLFMAKNLERIGDLTTNIAETLCYSVTGKRLTEERPKEDATPSIEDADLG